MENLGKIEECTASCTVRKIVLYEKVIGNRKRLSRITNSDLATKIFTGNVPKNSPSNECFMAETIDDSTSASKESRKRKRDEQKFDVPLSTRNLTPVTIMVVDTIGTIKSRRLLKVKKFIHGDKATLMV